MTDNPAPLDEHQRAFISSLEEFAELATNEPDDEDEREEATERAHDIADRVMEYLDAVEGSRRKEGKGGTGKITLEGMEEMETYLRETGFTRAALGMRVLIDRGMGELEHKARTTAPNK